MRGDTRSVFSEGENLKLLHFFSTFDPPEPIVNTKFIIFLEIILDTTGKIVYIISANISTLSHQVLKMVKGEQIIGRFQTHTAKDANTSGDS